jgi:Beta-propeller repeat
MKSRASLVKVLTWATPALLVSAFLLSGLHKNAIQKTRPVAGQTAQATRVATTPNSTTAAKLADEYGRLPLAFDKNLGQTDSRVRFLARGQGYEMFLTPSEAVLALHSAAPSSATRTSAAHKGAAAVPGSQARATSLSVIRMQLEGANPSAKIDGVDPLSRTSSYFIGSDPKNWHTNVPSYARVEYRDVYLGVDLMFYGNQRRLEYDYVVNPGASPKAIALNIEGARKMKVDSQGNLVMSLAKGNVELQKPLVYQDVDGKRQVIGAQYALNENHVSFAVAKYDESKPLIIDPVLVYSTYLGQSPAPGSPTIGDIGYGVAVDTSGDAYVTGQTYDASFPLSAGTTGHTTTAPAGVATNGAVFISEINPAGTTELAFTYIAGNGGELGLGISLDASDNVYITGQTFSTNYPTTSSNQVSTPPTGSAPTVGNAFVSELNSSLTTLAYSSYIGNGSNGEFGNAVAAVCTPSGVGAVVYACNLTNAASITASSVVYVTGYADTAAGTTPGFPITTNAYNGTLTTPAGNAFLTAINTTATSGTTALVYSTFLGGNDIYEGTQLPVGDEGLGVGADSAGDAYVVGATTSTNFPVTAHAYQSTFTSGNTAAEAFVTEINTSLGVSGSGAASLLYSSYLGGSGGTASQAGKIGDLATAVALGPSNVVYVTGQTTSPNFPVTSNTIPATVTNDGIAFVTLMNTTAGTVPYSTLLGGTGGELGHGIGTDALGNAYVAGASSSTNFPTTPGAFQKTLAAGSTGAGFISEVDPGGTGTTLPCSGAACLLYSTYFGGSGGGSPLINDVAGAIAVKSQADVYFTGLTASTNFPIYPTAAPAAFQTSLTSGNQAAFVANLLLEPTLQITPLSISFGTQIISTTSTAQYITLTNNTTSSITFSDTPPTNTDFTVTAAADGSTPACATSLAAGASCTYAVTFTPSTTTAESSSTTIAFTALSNPADSVTVALSGTGTAVPTFTISTLAAFPGTLVTTTSSPETLTITNTGAAAIPISVSATAGFAAAPGGTNACGSTIPATSSCTYNVTFTPTSSATNPVTGTLTVTSGPTHQTEALSGTVEDFTVTSPATVTATRGTPATFTVTVGSVGGFAGSVALTCTGTIPHGSCTVTSPVTAPGTATATVTTKSVLLPVSAPTRIPPVSTRQIVLMLLALTMLLMVPAVRRRWTKLGLAGAMLVFIVLAGCSSAPATPTGTYTVTITGTSSGVTHTATTSVTVN